jgi:tetratricopeptide (TPR) repeat protein
MKRERCVQSGHSSSDLGSIQDKVAAGRFDEALRELDEVLGADPENPEALYMSAVCRRYKADFDTALEIIARLKSVAPEHGRVHQEEGHAYRDMGRPDDALRAYARACRFNPALEASWRAQLEILSGKGLEQRAAAVAQQLQRLQMMPRPLVAVTDLNSQGRLLKAEEICRHSAGERTEVRPRQYPGAHRLHSGTSEATEIQTGP